MLELRYVSKDDIVVEDQSSKDTLARGFFGTRKGNALHLNAIEALYLMDIRNARCKGKGGDVSLSKLAAGSSKSEKFIARYFTYKDWRDRGLVIRADNRLAGKGRREAKPYPAQKLRLPKRKLTGTFFPSDLTSILDDDAKGKELYERFWMGQYGSYKAADRGQLNKLDVYETAFLIEKGLLKIDKLNRATLARVATARRKEFPQLYAVYKELRERGYVIKTGFKFGTNFRLYFPGAKPMKKDSNSWVHSKHVIHVFPKSSRLLISEWARVIRVAHSVRKTFILAVPGLGKAPRIDLDFTLYHRKGGEAENPDNAPPRYAMLSLSEEEYIGGAEFAGALEEAKRRKLDLIVAIADRETAVTYYGVRQIKLPGSKSDYYEIDWMQP